MRTWGRTAVVLCVLAGVAAPASAAPGRPADGFEKPVVTPGTYVTRTAGETFGRWTVTRGSIDQIGRGYWQAADSRQSIDLNGRSEGTVRTTAATQPSVRYRVSYYLAGNPAGGPAVKTGQVLINGTVRQTFSFDTTGRSFTKMGYVRRSFVFVGTGGPATIDFASTSGPTAYGPVIDKTSVVGCLTVACT
ncbi:choice-of-anchor C family protein [Actinoplanes sp. NPDC004185]